MKKILSPIFIFLFLVSFAQTPSTSKKWNDYNKRYEYFDSKGTLIAYEKYNDYKKQWEYFSKNDSDSTFGRKRKSLDLEYPTLSSSEITYAKTIGEQRALTEQRANAENNAKITKIHNENQKIVQKRVTEIMNEINDLEISQELKNKLINGMNSWVDYGNEKYTKLNNSDDVKKAISFYNGAYNDLQENFFYRNLSEIDKLKFDIGLKNINEIVAEAYRKVRELNISNTQKRKMFEDLDLYVDKGQKKFIQFENQELYRKAYNYYLNAYKFVLDKNLK